MLSEEKGGPLTTSNRKRLNHAIFDFHKMNELELAKGINISPVFNIVDLYPFHKGQTIDDIHKANSQFPDWRQVPKKKREEMWQSFTSKSSRRRGKN